MGRKHHKPEKIAGKRQPVEVLTEQGKFAPATTPHKAMIGSSVP